MSAEERRARFRVVQGGGASVRQAEVDEFHAVVAEWVNARIDPALKRCPDFLVRNMVHAVLEPLYQIGSRRADESGLAQFRALASQTIAVDDVDFIAELCFTSDAKKVLQWIRRRVRVIVHRSMKPSRRIVYDPMPYVEETVVLATCMLLQQHDVRRLPVWIADL